MPDVSKIRLPDDSEVNIKDSRITGVDTTPISGSGNVVTSGGVYTAIQNGFVPLASVSYQGFASNSSYSVHCFIKVRPTDWNEVYKVRFFIRAYIPNVDNSYAESQVLLVIFQGKVKTYYIENVVIDTNYRPYYQLYYYGLTDSGYTNGASEFYGIYINSANTYSYTTKRQLSYELLSVENCTAELFSSDKNTSEAKGTYTASGYYRSSVKYNIYTAGLQETGDSNTTYSVITSSEAETGTATTGRTVSAASLKRDIEYRMAQNQADWNEATTTAPGYIKNKPTAITNSEIDTIMAS